MSNIVSVFHAVANLNGSFPAGFFPIPELETRVLSDAVSDESYNMLPVLSRNLSDGVIIYRYFDVFESSVLWLNGAKSLSHLGH